MDIYLRDAIAGNVVGVEVDPFGVVNDVRTAVLQVWPHWEGHSIRLFFQGAELGGNMAFADIGMCPESVIEVHEGADLSEDVVKAVQRNSLKDLQSLLGQGATPNATDDGGRTALHFAAGKGMLEMVQAVVEAGATPGARDGAGRTPLHWVAIPCAMDELAQRCEVAEYLLTKGLAGTETDHRGSTAAATAKRFRAPCRLCSILRDASGETDQPDVERPAKVEPSRCTIC
eukprot:Hpha_TRINITY_DN16545_c6_g4::TRINITY_DN16545_c6_g4_i1::g.133139::m.133139